jgi:hypothetical protein
MSTALTIASLAIVALVLARDWGHRRVTLFALCRPLIAAAVILPFVAPGWSASGHGLLLEIAALVLGIAVGLGTAAFMRVSMDVTGQAWTDAGYPYAAAWVAFTAARLLFVYGCEHWFTRGLGMFLVDNHIAVTAFADSIMFVFIAPVVTNRLAIGIRTRMLAGRGRVAAAAH